MIKNTDGFNFNIEYIKEHTLDSEIVKDALSRSEYIPSDTEIFVEHPYRKEYYGSQYGAVISLKRKTPELLAAFPGGQPDRRYLYYGLSNGEEPPTIGMHRVVADIFCPNFWGKNVKLVAHHCDGDKFNNDWRNLVLLTTKLHGAIHKIKKMKLLVNGKMIECIKPLEIVAITGLTLEDILLVKDSKKKPLKSEGGYTVFNIKGNIIAYQFYPEKNKKKWYIDTFIKNRLCPRYITRTWPQKEDEYMKNTIVIFSASKARELLRNNFKLIDIKPDKTDPDHKRSVFIFKNEIRLIEQLKEDNTNTKKEDRSVAPICTSLEVKK